MTTGELKAEVLHTGLKEVLGLSLPVIVAVASVTLMQVADFWMVAKLGEAQAASVMPAGMLVFTLISFLIGVLSCNSTFVSQCYGKGHKEDCARYTWQSIYISLMGGGGGDAAVAIGAGDFPAHRT